MRLFVLTATLVAISAVGGVAAEGKKLALLVGVEKYKHQDLTPLKYCCDDVKTLAGVLARQGFTCRLLADDGYDPRRLADKPTESGQVIVHGLPTRSTISIELKKLLDGVGRDDLILVVLSGHGLQPTGASQPYFCPMDANPMIRLGFAESNGKSRPKQELSRPETMLGIGDLLGQLKDSGIGQRFVLVDACRNAPATKGSKNAGAATVAMNLVPENCSVLMSCSAGEQSFEDAKFGIGGSGVFLNAVIEGLEGSAANAKGEVTWGNLANYVPERVKESMLEVFGDNQRQTPNEFKNASMNPVLTITASRPRVGLSIPSEAVPVTKPLSGTTELLVEDFRSVEEYRLPDGWVRKNGTLAVCHRGRAHLRSDDRAVGDRDWDGDEWSDSPSLGTVVLSPVRIVGDFEIELELRGGVHYRLWRGKRTFSLCLKGRNSEKLLLRCFENQKTFVASMSGSEESDGFSLWGREPTRFAFSRIERTYRVHVESKLLLEHQADEDGEFDQCELTISPDIYVCSVRIGPPDSGRELKVPLHDPAKTNSTPKQR